MPARPAIAARCTSASVDPLIACKTTDALPSAAFERMSRGHGPPATAIWAARLPVASARRMRLEETAGAVAAPGRGEPSGSVKHALVAARPLALPGPAGP